MPKYHISKKGKVEECRATIRACPLGGDHIEANSTEEAIEKFDEIHDGVDTEEQLWDISIEENKEYGVEMYFSPIKLPQDVFETLKASEWRWNEKKKCWYIKQSEA